MDIPSLFSGPVGELDFGGIAGAIVGYATKKMTKLVARVRPTRGGWSSGGARRKPGRRGRVRHRGGWDRDGGIRVRRPQTIRPSLPRLVQLAGGGAGLAPARNWRDVPFPDGSGWMRLPEGWVIAFAQKGMASAKGPHGLIERGVWTQAYTRAAMAQHMAAFSGMPPPTIVVDPTDLVAVFQAYFAHVRSFSRQRDCRLETFCG